jgi:hypothetical protein
MITHYRKLETSMNAIEQAVFDRMKPTDPLPKAILLNDYWKVMRSTRVSLRAI